MSFLGVAVAAVSMRYFISEDLNRRRFGVVLFKVRDFIDSLDGAIAREVRNSHGDLLVANPESLGWMIDGVCDGIADVLRFIAYIIYLQKIWDRTNGKKSWSNGNISYSILEEGEAEKCSKSIFLWRRKIYQMWTLYKRPVMVVLLIALQTLVTSIIWNYVMINYHRVLETDQYMGDSSVQSVAESQNSILQSSSFVMVCFLWRLINPQIMNQFQFVAILPGVEVEFFQGIYIYGRIPPIIVGAFSYSHLQYSIDLIKNASLGLL